MEIKRVRVTKSCWKQVTCEACGHSFEYKLTRTVVRDRTDLLDPFGSARAQLESDTGQTADWLLKTETDWIPCPACGIYQADMARHITIRPSWVIGGMIVAIILMLVLIEKITARALFPPVPTLVVLAVAGLILYKPIAAMCDRWSGYATDWIQAKDNADREANKQVAADMIAAGTLRSRPGPRA